MQLFSHKCLTILFLFFTTLNSHLAYAQTSEIEAAKRDYERQQQIAEREREQLNRAIQNTNDQSRIYDRERSKQQDLESRLDQAERKVIVEQQNIDSYTRKIEDEQRNIDRINSRKESLLNERQNLNSRQQKLIDTIKVLSDEINVLTDKISDAQSRGDKDEAQRLISQKQAKLAERDRTRSDLDSVNARLLANRNELADLNNQLTQSQNNIQTYRSRREDAKRDLTNARDEVARIRPQVQDAAANSQRELDRLNDLRSVQRQAQDRYDREKRLAQEKYDYYQRLIREYEQKRDDAILLGQRDGNIDGAREADRTASQDGQRTGDSQGASAGESKAKLDATDRDYYKGYKQGFLNGASDPSLKNQYTSGFQAGETIAINKAKAEDFPKGYNSALQALGLSIPSKSATLDISDELPLPIGTIGNDLQESRKSVGSVNTPKTQEPRNPSLTPPTISNVNVQVPNPSRGEYDPPCSQLDFDFRDFCLDAYESYYYSSFRGRYKSSYESSYVKSYNMSSATRYNQTLNTYTDKSAFDSGLKKGANDLGLIEGFDKTYVKQKDMQFSQGEKALEAQRKEGFLIKYVSSKLSDANGDGLLSAGEHAIVELVIDNLGLASSPLEELRLKISNSTNLTMFNHTLRDLPSLEGNTRTTISGVIKGLVNSQYANADLKLEAILQYKASNGNFVDLAFANPTQKVRFPIEMIQAMSDQGISTDSESPIKLTFRNNTNSTSSSNVIKLSSLESQLVFGNTKLELPELQAGESKTLEVLAKASQEPSVNPKIVIQSELENSGLKSQLFESALKIIRDAAVRLYYPNGTMITTPVSVNAGVEFEILGSLEYLSEQSSIGPMVLKVTDKTQGINFANNSTVSIDYGKVSKGTTVGKSKFRFITSSDMKGKTGEISFTLTNNKKLTHIAKLIVQFK